MSLSVVPASGAHGRADVPASIDADQSRSRTLLGTTFTALSRQQAVDVIVHKVLDEAGGWLTTPNLSIARELEHEPSLRWALAESSEILADGVPLVWLARRAAVNIGPRVTGAELVPAVFDALPHGTRVMFVGGPPGEAADAAAKATSLGMNVVCADCPPFGFDSSPQRLRDYLTLLCDRVEAGPQLVVVALPFPRQQFVSALLRERFPGAYFMNVGAAVGFWLGRQSRAPGWMQRAGMEWAHRLWQEPRRLARRYLRNDLPFFLMRWFGFRTSAGYIYEECLPALQTALKAGRKP